MSLDANAMQWYMTAKKNNKQRKCNSKAKTKTLLGWRTLHSPLKPKEGLNGPPAFFFTCLRNHTAKAKTSLGWRAF
jgi:hypothetical protein